MSTDNFPPPADFKRNLRPRAVKINISPSKMASTTVRATRSTAVKLSGGILTDSRPNVKPSTEGTVRGHRNDSSRLGDKLRGEANDSSSQGGRPSDTNSGDGVSNLQDHRGDGEGLPAACDQPSSDGRLELAATAALSSSFGAERAKSESAGEFLRPDRRNDANEPGVELYNSSDAYKESPFSQQGQETRPNTLSSLVGREQRDVDSSGLAATNGSGSPRERRPSFVLGRRTPSEKGEEARDFLSRSNDGSSGEFQEASRSDWLHRQKGKKGHHWAGEVESRPSRENVREGEGSDHATPQGDQRRGSDSARLYRQTRIRIADGEGQSSSCDRSLPELRSTPISRRPVDFSVGPGRDSEVRETNQSRRENPHREERGAWTLSGEAAQVPRSGLEAGHGGVRVSDRERSRRAGRSCREHIVECLALTFAHFPVSLEEQLADRLLNAFEAELNAPDFSFLDDFPDFANDGQNFGFPEGLHVQRTSLPHIANDETDSDGGNVSPVQTQLDIENDLGAVACDATCICPSVNASRFEAIQLAQFSLRDALELMTKQLHEILNFLQSDTSATALRESVLETASKLQNAVGNLLADETMRLSEIEKALLVEARQTQAAIGMLRSELNERDAELARSLDTLTTGSKAARINLEYEMSELKLMMKELISQAHSNAATQLGTPTMTVPARVRMVRGDNGVFATPIAPPTILQSERPVEASPIVQSPVVQRTLFPSVPLPKELRTARAIAPSVQKTAHGVSTNVAFSPQTPGWFAAPSTRVMNPESSFEQPKTAVATTPRIVEPKPNDFPKYDGRVSSNLEKFITTVDNMQRHGHLPDAVILKNLHHMLTETAHTWYSISSSTVDDCWVAWKQAIFDRFHNFERQSYLMKRLTTLRFPECVSASESEPAAWWLNELLQVYLALHPTAVASEILQMIILHCNTSLAYDVRREHDFNVLDTVEKIIEHVTTVSSRHWTIFKTRQAHQVQQARPNRPVLTPNFPQRRTIGYSMPTEKLATYKCYNCNELGHLGRNCPKGLSPKAKIAATQWQAPAQGRPISKTIVCYNCNEPGHIARECQKALTGRAKIAAVQWIGDFDHDETMDNADTDAGGDSEEIADENSKDEFSAATAEAGPSAKVAAIGFCADEYDNFSDC